RRTGGGPSTLARKWLLREAWSHEVGWDEEADGMSKREEERTEHLWKIDPAHSAVEFMVKHMMFTTVRGRFREFRGSIRIDEAHPERSFVEVEIEAASIDSGSADRDRHLRSEDFLHV